MWGDSQFGKGEMVLQNVLKKRGRMGDEFPIVGSVNGVARSPRHLQKGHVYTRQFDVSCVDLVYTNIIMDQDEFSIAWTYLKIKKDLFLHKSNESALEPH